MQLFYNPRLDNSSAQFFFSADESRHIVKVLRKKEGDELHITNGKGSLYTAKILAADIRKCKVQITEEEKTIPKRHRLHLAVAPTKMNDRYEWFLEKATEIGIDEITPILCDHSERKTLKLERMERVLQSAMKQSLQTFLPKLNPPIAYEDFVAQDHNATGFIAHCDDGERMELKRRIVPDSSILIMIGPEGDFSKEEISTALKKGFLPVSLGKTRLRTETAAIVACAIVALANS
ncbi:16S rRNA (uracil(1498)-N(3))-methyltransferase [Flagellimonas allohymeniacidonis]|uniref:Ribosomal RNA small subunit methyltransferase E n=1 Tax=Flagellimonas allohymeniacidonis TaxID=2517819 RepID=A0A4Q8QFQ2_9FLAO|nr:16S rRNA (uracil(1498)-N(3))-methyltransferase [Allomuricauda hymeniacidonis]TAI48537.1 16S rRNA (uracil(1498)-N(3))-methyltransferase [Allomuricauda hymeniacidonis]